MKHIRKALSLTLALVLTLSMAVPAFAAASEITSSINVNDATPISNEGTQSFKLRNWEWGDESWGELTTIKKGTATEFSTDNVYQLPLGTAVTFHYGGQVNDMIWLRAWSDPDKDGIYDQRLVLDDGTVLPASEAGPLTSELDSETHRFYSNGGAPSADNGLDVYCIGVFDAEDISFSSGWLTQQFGPDTLVAFEVKGDFDKESQTRSLDTYYFYLTGEAADPTILDAETTVSVTRGGALTAPWAADMISDAETNGLIPKNLYGFDLTTGINRGDFAAVAVNLYEALSGNKIPAANSPFDDLFSDGISVDNYQSICKAYSMGFVSGTSETTFSPGTTLNREQAAVMLSRVYAKLYGDIPAVSATAFADDASVSGWAKSAVAFMSEKGMVSGVGNNNFAPQNTLSSQEALIIAERMLENLK